MNRLVAIQRNSYQKVVLCKECCPFCVDGKTVRLDPIADRDARGILSGYFGCKMAEVFFSCHCRLAALKGESNAALRTGRLQSAADDQISRVFRHDTHAGQFPVGSLIGIKTVATAHIAQTGCGFYKQIDKGHIDTFLNNSDLTVQTALSSILPMLRGRGCSKTHSLPLWMHCGAP